MPGCNCQEIANNVSAIDADTESGDTAAQGKLNGCNNVFHLPVASKEKSYDSCIVIL
jgi:hypothetical protein